MYETDSIPQRKAGTWWPWLIALFFFAWWARDSLPRIFYGPAASRVVTPRGDLAEDEASNIELFDAAVPSAVHVSPAERIGELYDLSGTGSGVMWDDAGHVVTNFHVVGEATQAVVTLADGSTWNGLVVGVAPDKDVAVLRVDAPRHLLRAMPLGSSKDLRVGQKVFAIGNPFGLDFTLTTGVVSALDRQITAPNGRIIHGVIQTDAAINPGNSGGPLLDSAGRLIGVNTAIYSPSGGSSGIGFAVPVDVVNRVVPQLIAHGRVIRPGLGILIDLAEPTRVKYRLAGVPVMNVQEGSAAAAAGLAPPRRRADGSIIIDVIMGVDDTPTPDLDALYSSLEQHQIGDTVRVQVRRQILRTQVFEELTLLVTLQAIE